MAKAKAKTLQQRRPTKQTWKEGRRYASTAAGYTPGQPASSGAQGGGALPFVEQEAARPAVDLPSEDEADTAEAANPELETLQRRMQQLDLRAIFDARAWPILAKLHQEGRVPTAEEYEQAMQEIAAVPQAAQDLVPQEGPELQAAMGDITRPADPPDSSAGGRALPEPTEVKEETRSISSEFPDFGTPSPQQNEEVDYDERRRPSISYVCI